MGNGVPTGITIPIKDTSSRSNTTCLLILFCLSLAACQPPEPTTETVETTTSIHQIIFTPMGVEIAFDLEPADELRSIQVFDDTEISIGSLALAGKPASTEKVYFRWHAGQTYRFLFEAETEYQQFATSPPDQKRGTLQLGIPFIQNQSSSLRPPITLIQHSQTRIAVQTTNGELAPADFQLRIELPFTAPLIRTGRFISAFETWHTDFQIKIPGQANTGEITAILRVTPSSGQPWQIERQLPFAATTVEEVSTGVSIDKIQLPTDVKGHFFAHLQPDTLVLKQPLSSRRSSTDYGLPIAFQTIHLQNRLPTTIPVIVSAIVRDLQTQKPVLFLSLAIENRSESFRSFSAVNLKPETVTTVSLPIHLNPGLDPQTGDYQRLIQVKMWGTQQTIDQQTLPLRISVPNQRAIIITILSIALTVIGLLFFVGRWQQLFSLFSSKNLILISLFGATIFAFVNLPATILINIANAVLGPLAFLITGIFNEILYFTLLTALLTLIPKSGTIILVSTVRFLLNGVLLGTMTPIALIYLSVSALLLEIGFLLTGRGLRLIWMALVFGLCDACSVYVDFQIGITLYRLFYADWYVWLMVSLGGFLYTFIGVLFGRQLGRNLRHVAD